MVGDEGLVVVMVVVVDVALGSMTSLFFPCGCVIAVAVIPRRLLW